MPSRSSPIPFAVFLTVAGCAGAAIPSPQAATGPKPSEPKVEEPVAPKTDPTTLVAPDADARVRRARLTGGEPAWSEEALFAMGVPKVICDAVAAACAVSDLEWMAALEGAIVAKTPPTARSNELLCTLGQGRKAAVAMLRAGVAGIPPGILYIDGNEVVATPTELALAVRSLLPR